MDNITRTERTQLDIIEPADGYRIVRMKEGDELQFFERLYVPKGAEPQDYTTMSESEATDLTMRIDYAWENYLNKQVEKGTKVYYEGKMYEVRQPHTPLIIWKPNEVPALYRLSTLSEGTMEDPIAWESGMTCENGKYYTFGDRLYQGIRDSGDPLYYNPTDLLGNYFSEISTGGGADTPADGPAAEAGTQGNPIPWSIGMVSENGKYYESNGRTYLCIRDSGNPLYFDPSALLGNYFNEA